jgi:outer membrane protein assembly factor BamB/ABC-type phosphate/phosphonate transport system substrate-binding protein
MRSAFSRRRARASAPARIRRRYQRVVYRLGAVGLALLLTVAGLFGKPPAKEPEPAVLVVLDPLAKELACACVKGFGQRDYRKLAAKLETTLKQRVSIEFSDDLEETLAIVGSGREVVVVGERSLVAHSAARAKLACHPVAELTGLDGETTVKAVFVAEASDPAKELKDLAGRKVLVGLPEADVQHAAALDALRSVKLDPPATPENRGAGNKAALDVLDSTTSPPPVAVIPSYALRLLEGCGSITPGDLKIIGSTMAAPFITAFVSDNFAADKERMIVDVLLGLKRDAKLLKAMESRDGFVPVNAPKKAGAQIDAEWPDWRGPRRDGLVPRLPMRLPERVKLIWKKATMTGGLAGLSVSGGRLILAERDFEDERDVYRCLDADNGELLWRIEFPAPGHLDYGQSPRATPVIHEERAYLLGAFGELRCVNVADGKVLWKRHLAREFKAALPTWGMCSPPLVVDDLLIVNPGGAKASLVALDRATGRTRWAAPGLPAAYSAFICGDFGGARQIVGYDRQSLGGWDVKNGARLWKLVPPTEGDFNVPTPIAVDGGILVSTENNGTRLYRFNSNGRIIPEPAGTFAGLNPDTATPVATCGRVFGVKDGLHCLDAQGGLKPIWHDEETAAGDYATVIADGERVLVITLSGELLLLDAKSNTCAILSRLRLFEEDVEVYPHPALVGSRLYVRGGDSVICVDLATN